MSSRPPIDRRTWQQFYDVKGIWFINRILHVFGWSLIVTEEEGQVTEVFPARTTWLGFTPEINQEGLEGFWAHADAPEVFGLPGAKSEG